MNRNPNDKITTNDYNNQVLDKARWEQESLAGTGANPINPFALTYVPTAFKNLLVNGGFELNNLAPSAPAAGVNYTVDGWVGIAGTTAYEIIAFRGGIRSIALAVNGGEIAQYLENPIQYRNTNVFVTAYVRNSTNAWAKIDDGISAVTQTIVCPVGGSFQLVQVHKLIDPAATMVKISFHNVDATNRLNVDDVMANTGYGWSDFYVDHPAMELRRAMRFYQQVRCTARFRGLTNLTEKDVAIPLPVPMGGTPSFVQTNSATTLNLNRGLTSPTGVPAGVQSDRLVYKFVPTAAGDCYCIDDIIALSWYPPNDQGL